MKQLQLELKKRLLIVEMTGELDTANVFSWNNQPVEKICKGSELTEDIAKGFLHQSIHTGLFAHYVKDIPVNTYCYKTALEAFDAVIYAYGYHWKNPLGISTEEIRQRHGDASDMFNEWLEYEKKTFNPSECIICEIL